MPLARLAVLWFALVSLAAQQQSLGFEKGKPGALPDPWFVMRSSGWSAELVEGKAPAGEKFAKLAKSGDARVRRGSPFGNVMCRVPGFLRFAGKKARLTAKIRVVGDGRAQMWMRVDRKGRQRGAIDNMGDRPLTSDRWTKATIELDVAADAIGIMLGVMAFGDVEVFVDDVVIEGLGDRVELQQATAATPLTKRELRNALAASRLLGYLWFFHPSQSLVELDEWDRFAVKLLDAALPANDDRELAAKLAAFCEPVAPTVTFWRARTAPPPFTMPEGATHRWLWEHRGCGRAATMPRPYRSEVLKRRVRGALRGETKRRVEHSAELVDGLMVRVPLVTFGTRDGTLPTRDVPDGWLGNDQLDAAHRTTRLAAVAQAWNIFHHFYPYFDAVDGDWLGALPKYLQAAAVAEDGRAAGDVLSRLVSMLNDGHGNVAGAARTRDGFFPAAVRWAGKDLVVTGLGRGVKGLSVGDVIVAFDGKPVASVYAEMTQLISSATDGYARSRSQMMFAMWPTADPVPLSVRRPDGSVAKVEVPRGPSYVADRSERRPANGSALGDGIVYFDMNGAPMSELAKHLEALKNAKGIVFDMRGYPGDAGGDILKHLMTEDGTSAAWGVPIVQLPDRLDWKWDGSGRWQMKPKRPHLAAEVAFLTDGRAISYAESIMGIVEAYKLGEIVGATTAGTNGNVNAVQVAGGFRIGWTGMRVLKHDGSAHHGVGIAPTVPVEPTAKGIAEGRDEVLERAIEVLKKKIG